MRTIKFRIWDDEVTNRSLIIGDKHGKMIYDRFAIIDGEIW